MTAEHELIHPAVASDAFWRRVVQHVRNGTVMQRCAERWRYRRALARQKWWDSRRGRTGFVVQKLEEGARIRLYFDSELSRLIYDGHFERAEREFIRSFLRPGDTFVDVGANIGLFSLIASRLVGNSGRVFAFEPCAETWRRLKDNSILNHCSNLSCVQAALSDLAGTTTLSVSRDGMDAWNALAERPFMGNDFVQERIDAVRWDDFAKERGLVGHVALMKIDVEGWESHVLQGAAEALSRDDAPVLQVEFTDAAAIACGGSCQQLYQEIKSFGFSLYRFDDRTGDLSPEPPRDQYGYVNLFAVKNESACLSRLCTVR